MDITIKTILCATDFSECSHHTLSFALLVARRFGARIYLCHVIDMSYAAVYSYSSSRSPEEQEKLISACIDASFRECPRDPVVTWEPLVAKGHPAVELSRIAEEKHADLVIVGTHGRSGTKWLVLGSVAERLMKTMTCPLLTVNAPEGQVSTCEADGYRLRRILVGCDFSRDAALALQYGLRLALAFQAELHLGHVLEPNAYEDLRKKRESAGNHAAPGDTTQIESRLRGLIPEDNRRAVTCRTAILRGRPWDALNLYAREQQIDLIVLGARGHSLLGTLFLGSCTDRLIRQAPCPVLSVRSPEPARH